MNKITYTSLDERRKDLNSRSLSHEIFRENLAKELTTEKSSDPTRARELLESIKTSPNYIRSKFGYTQKGIDAFLTTCTDEEIKKECTSFNTV